MRILSLLAVLCALPGVAMAQTLHSHTGLSLTRSSFLKLPGWQQDAHGEALAAFKRSCSKLTQQPENAEIGAGMLVGKAKEWHFACAEAALVSEADTVGARAFFERVFVPFEVGYNNNPKGKITGYYEPLTRGSLRQKPGYEPIYGRPGDLVNGETYPLNRTQIDGGALNGRGLEKLWVEDPVDAFFLHVQGSGRVLLDTGETVSVRFDGKNNQPYTAIGKVLVERGALKREEVSAPAIRTWLHAHPEEARSIMQRNDSYVFFTVVPEVTDGPVGAQNVVLTPERSLAVDTQYIPLGMPVFISTQLPDSLYGKAQPYRRLMVAQDKGTAITGAVRGDVFFGYGERAEDLAGYMNSEGGFTVLVPQPSARAMEGKDAPQGKRY